MILKYPVAMAGLFLLTLSACERATGPVDSSSRAGESTDDPTLKQGVPLVLLSEEESIVGFVDQTNTVIPAEKPESTVAQTQGDEDASDDASAAGSGSVSEGVSGASAAGSGSVSEGVSGASAAGSGSVSEGVSGASIAKSGSVSVEESTLPSSRSIDGMGKIKFTVKQLVASGLLGEGGSNAYHSYVTSMLNKADKTLKQGAGGQEASDLLFLCNEDISDCFENGLSPEKLNKPMILRLIHVAGHTSSNFYETEDGESFFVLQGDPVTSDFIRNVMERMKRTGTRRILLNLPKNWTDINWFFDFASQLKEKQIDLHIVGQCGSFCANYFIPAARKVVIEPYGYIGYNGNFSGLIRDIEAVYSNWREDNKKRFYQEHFSQNEVQGLVKFFGQYSGSLRALMIFNQSVIGDSLNQVSRVLAGKPASSFWELSRERQSHLLGGMRQEGRDILKVFFFNLSKSQQQQTITRNYGSIWEAAQAEKNYYEESRIIPESKKGYSYLDFIHLTSWLVKDASYFQLFPSLPRPYYNIPEQEKPYLAVFPSADILRNLGIPIQGENNKEVLHTLYEGSESAFLYLSADDMENCDFFEDKKAPFTTETLQECLSQDGSLL